MNLIQYVGMDVHNDSIANRITGGRVYSVAKALRLAAPNLAAALNYQLTPLP